MQLKPGFEWVQLFEELAQKLTTYRSKQLHLVKLLQQCDINGLSDQYPKGISIPLTEMDPFTFFALINKHSFRNRARILTKIKSQLSLRSAVPAEFFGVPKAEGRQTWLFPYKFERDSRDVSKLWDLFEAVMSKRPIANAIFDQARNVKYAGHAKLTQAIFRVAPQRFFPIDSQTIGYLAGLRLPSTFDSAKEFQRICSQVRAKVTKPIYEQSHDAWLANRKRQPSNEINYQTKALKAAARPVDIREIKGGVPVSKIKKTGMGAGGYTRSHLKAAKAIRLANHRCELNDRHETFISNSKGKPYVEAHHLIPFSEQGSYAFSLDELANIVALCPNCHRRLHFGKTEDKANDIKHLFLLRREGLAEKRLNVGEKELLKKYRSVLLDEDS